MLRFVSPGREPAEKGTDLLVQLKDIEKGKPARYVLDVSTHLCGDPAFPIEVATGQLKTTIEDHRDGYLLSYQIEAKVQAPCSSCGELLDFVVSSQGRLGLSLVQPEEGHVVLKPSDLDVRFLEEPQLDLQHFFDEQVELEIPQFPRHGDEDACQRHYSEILETEKKTDEESSPFSVLSSLLESENGSKS